MQTSSKPRGIVAVSSIILGILILSGLKPAWSDSLNQTVAPIADSSLANTTATISIAEDPVAAVPPRMIVTTQRLLIGDGTVADTLLISLQPFAQKIAGFDLKIAITSEAIDIADVLPGEIPDSCGWEMFDARSSRMAGQEGYPRQLWQAIALAETVPRPGRSTCRGLDREASLIRVVLVSNPLVPTPDTTVPIFFFWEDCGDNTIADATGSVLAMSSQLYDVFPTAGFDDIATFPTRLGAPRHCVDPASLNKPIRMIEFRNGGVEFRYGADPDSSRIRSVRSELCLMLQEDVRSCDLLDSLEMILDWESDTVQQAYRDQAAMGDRHLARLEQIVTEFGWPSQSLFGSEAVSAAFIVVQHSDPEQMEKYLPMIKAAAQLGEISRGAAATMEDRILVFRGEPQIYGTQVCPDPVRGGLALSPLADPSRVDSLRADVGLPPLFDYLKQFGIEYKSADSSQ